MAHLITGIFHSRENAEHAVDDLIRAGFSHNDVSLLMTDKTKARDFDIKKATKAPEGAATGAAIGGTLGAVAAGLAAVGSITIPGFALFAAGPLVAALTGLGAGAAAGGITARWSDSGCPSTRRSSTRVSSSAVTSSSACTRRTIAWRRRGRSSTLRAPSASPRNDHHADGPRIAATRRTR
jgi:hypothetical protein